MAERTATGRRKGISLQKKRLENVKRGEMKPNMQLEKESRAECKTRKRWKCWSWMDHSREEGCSFVTTAQIGSVELRNYCPPFPQYRFTLMLTHKRVYTLPLIQAHETVHSGEHTHRKIIKVTIQAEGKIRAASVDPVFGRGTLKWRVCQHSSGIIWVAMGVTIQFPVLLQRKTLGNTLLHTLTEHTAQTYNCHCNKSCRDTRPWHVRCF